MKAIRFWTRIQVLALAVKYFLQGDKWRFAVEYAESLVKGWKRHG